MKITKVYLDLKEAKPEERFWKEVWVLESEAFKDPLTFQLEYEPKDLEYEQELKKEILSKIDEFQMILEKEQERSSLLEANNKQLREEIILRDEKIQELKKESQKKEKEGIRFSQEIEVLLKRVDTLTAQLEDTEGNVTEIKQKLTKQPKVIHDTTFLSWIWQSYLGVIDIPDGEYLLIRQTHITEKNEFVANEDELIFDRIHVNDWYAPEYILKGTDAVSTPTATIDRTLTFIPI